jgi:hypothetical protein
MHDRDKNWLENALTYYYAPGVRARLEAWLILTPDHQVADLLLRVLNENNVFYGMNRFVAAFALLVTVGMILYSLLNGGTGVLWTLVLVPFVASLFPGRWAGYRRAALLLAERGDDRAIPFLLEFFYWPGRYGRRSEESKAVVAHLTRLLTHTQPTGTQAHVAESLRDFARRRLFGRAFQARVVGDADADLFLCVVRYLAAHGGTADQSLLVRLATLTPASPNARAVVEAARYALEPPTPRPVAARSTVETPTIIHATTGRNNQGR